MTELTKFECDYCGELWGHVTEMFQIPIRVNSVGGREARYVAPDTKDLHVCIDCVPRDAYEIFHAVSKYKSNESGYVAIRDVGFDGSVDVDYFYYEDRDRTATIIDAESWDAEYAVDFVSELIYGNY